MIEQSENTRKITQLENTLIIFITILLVEIAE